MPRMSLGQKIDALYTKRSARIAKQKEYDASIAEMKKEESDLREDIIAALEKSGLDKGTGSEATASIQVNLLPRPTDWESIYKYIKKNDAWDLLERRIGKLAFKSRLELGEHVPGIDVFEEKDLSLTKSSR